PGHLAGACACPSACGRAVRYAYLLLQQVDDPQHDAGHRHVDHQIEVEEREVADLWRRAGVERHVKREPDVGGHQKRDHRRYPGMSGQGTLGFQGRLGHGIPLAGASDVTGVTWVTSMLRSPRRNGNALLTAKGKLLPVQIYPLEMGKLRVPSPAHPLGQSPAPITRT